MCAPRVTRHTSIRYSSSWHTRVNMGDFCLHKHPVSLNCLYHARMVLSAGGSFAYCARNARCTVTTDLLCDIPTHKTTSPPGAAIFSQHTPASPSGRNGNCDEKQFTGEFFFFSCSFYLYRFRESVFYGFPIINFCNPGVHYETPGIIQVSLNSLNPASTLNSLPLLPAANNPLLSSHYLLQFWALNFMSLL